MSVTFQLHPAYQTVTKERHLAVLQLPCPDCGGTGPYVTQERIEADPNCPVCLGHGGDSAAEKALLDSAHDGEFTVTNANARYIISDLLGLPGADIDDGSIASDAVLRALAISGPFKGVVDSRVEQSVRISMEGVSDGPTIHHGGRSLDQCERYISKLRALAELAIKRGAPQIVWG